MKSRVFGLCVLFVCLLGTLPGAIMSRSHAADQKVEVLKESPWRGSRQTSWQQSLRPVFASAAKTG